MEGLLQHYGLIVLENKRIYVSCGLYVISSGS